MNIKMKRLSRIKVFCIATICFGLLTLNGNSQSNYTNKSIHKNTQAFSGTNGRQVISSPFDKQKPFIIPTTNSLGDSPKGLIAIYDSIYYWQWDTLNNVWYSNPDQKAINITYNSGNKQTNILYQAWTGTNWMNSSQLSCTYDTNNNQTSALYKSWNSTSLTNSWQYIYTYNSNKKLASALFQTWNDTVLVNSTLNTYSYDTYNNKTGDLIQSWNGSSWDNSTQYTYAFNSSNNMTNALGQSWNGTAWTNSWKDTITYDANNNKANELDQTWNGTSWVDNGDYSYKYNASYDLTSVLFQSWAGTGWECSTFDSYEYDAFNNMTNVFEQNWNGSGWSNYLIDSIAYDTHNNKISDVDHIYTSSWICDKQNAYAYNTDNFMLSSSTKQWNNTGTKIIYGDSVYYYFHTVTGINDLIEPNESVNVYPNPATDNLTIEASQNSAIEILNIEGQLIKSIAAVAGNTKIDVSSLNAGMYFMEIKTGKGVAVKKFIKE